jgi:hypothetical protein
MIFSSMFFLTHIFLAKKKYFDMCCDNLIKLYASPHYYIPQPTYTFTSVNPVHNAPVELPPPHLVLHWALPSPTPQNTPQGTGANGITPER